MENPAFIGVTLSDVKEIMETTCCCGGATMLGSDGRDSSTRVPIYQVRVGTCE
jgi:hypothetical protein